jgi:hypothetical protein
MPLSAIFQLYHAMPWQPGLVVDEARVPDTTWVSYKKGCTRLAAASDKVYQLLAHGRWFSQGTPASCTSKKGCHDLAEILLKMALNTKNHSNSTD